MSPLLFPWLCFIMSARLLRIAITAVSLNIAIKHTFINDMPFVYFRVQLAQYDLECFFVSLLPGVKRLYDNFMISIYNIAVTLPFRKLLYKNRTTLVKQSCFDSWHAWCCASKYIHLTYEILWVISWSLCDMFLLSYTIEGKYI